MMDLNHAAAFVRVVERGSFTKAAEELQLPTSSVSRAVTKLEQDLGVTLLLRTTRKITLTEAGRTYFDRVRGAMVSLEEAGALAVDEAVEPHGVVRLAAPPDMAEVLARSVARFARAQPRIHTELLFSHQSVDLLEDGADLAVTAGRVDGPSVIVRPIGGGPLFLFAAPAYLKRRAAPRTPADLRRHDCVLHQAVRGVAVWDLVGPDGRARVEVHGPTSSEQMSYVIGATIAGMGIGLASGFHAQAAVADGRLEPVLPGWMVEGPAVSLVYSSRHLPHRAGLLRDALLADLTKLSCLKHKV